MASSNYEKFMALMLKSRQDPRNQEEAINKDGIKYPNNGISNNNIIASAANSNFMSGSKNMGDIRFDMS